MSTHIGQLHTTSYFSLGTYYRPHEKSHFVSDNLASVCLKDNYMSHPRALEWGVDNRWGINTNK